MTTPIVCTTQGDEEQTREHTNDHNACGIVNKSSGMSTVPTKMDITIKLLPVNTRQQVSQQFSLQNYANGQGLKGGFW